MKFLNKVIVFVMGVVVIGIVTTSIGVVTQSKNVEKSVTFELLDGDTLAYDVYDKINKYAIYDNDFSTNLVSVSVNGDYNIFNAPFIIKSENDFLEIMANDNDYPNIIIYDNNTYMKAGLEYGDIIIITFNVVQETPAIIKTLLFLAPLILSASLIGFLAFKKGDE